MRRSPEDKAFYSQITRLVIPIAIQTFMLALVSATDAVMLGFVDQNSLSAVSLATQVQFVFNLFVSAMAIGTGIIAAQYWGKRDVASIERVIPIALRMNLGCGALFTLAAAICPELLMRILTNDADLVARGAGYLRLVSPSYLLCGISQIYLTVLKNTDHANISSKISSSAVVLNIALNGILIFGWLGMPRLEIRGAAIATVAARLMEVVWSYFETRKPERVRVIWANLLQKNRELAGYFWQYTMPVLGASLVWGIAYVMYSVIMGHMGSDAVAANSVTTIARSLILCLTRGISGGAGIIIGNLLGAGELDKAKDYGRRLTHMAIFFGFCTGCTLMAISPLIVRFAGFSPQVSEYMQAMLLFCGINVMFQAVNNTVLDGIFCAGGDSRFDMIGNIGAMWCFSVPMGFIAAFWLKLPPMVVYCIVNMDEIVKIPAVYLHYKKYVWVRNITKNT